MNTKSITIIRGRVRIALLAIAAVAFLPVAGWAHGGEEHVIGTVAKVSDTAVTVKTKAGKAVEVGFDAKTTYSRAEKPVQKADIKAGDRVVIHAVEVNEKLVAHTVELGAAVAAAKSK
ncbi:MAG TPA: hypothetical protein VHZ74_04430 [Bryobacteraceae bacterium]|jgi:hypothetical protein|nr:hypothetical protein [Bryobacteraceae bacterium]